MEKLLHLAFTAQRLDYIAQVLAARPYAEVATTLADIQRQLATQQGEPGASEPAAPALPQQATQAAPGAAKQEVRP